MTELLTPEQGAEVLRFIDGQAWGDFAVEIALLENSLRRLSYVLKDPRPPLGMSEWEITYEEIYGEAEGLSPEEVDALDDDARQAYARHHVYLAMILYGLNENGSAAKGSIAALVRGLDEITLCEIP